MTGFLHFEKIRDLMKRGSTMELHYTAFFYSHALCQILHLLCEISIMFFSGCRDLFQTYKLQAGEMRKDFFDSVGAKWTMCIDLKDVHHHIQHLLLIGTLHRFPILHKLRGLASGQALMQMNSSNKR